MASNARVEMCWFFALPLKIRHSIYKLVAENTVLRMEQGSTSPPGLALTSKQCNQEYASMLLAHAQLRFPAVHYDFDRILAFVARLKINEVPFLLHNHHLCIEIQVWAAAPFDGVVESLRRWCRKCSTSADRLSQLKFNYDIVIVDRALEGDPIDDAEDKLLTVETIVTNELWMRDKIRRLSDRFARDSRLFDVYSALKTEREALFSKWMDLLVARFPEEVRKMQAELLGVKGSGQSESESDESSSDGSESDFEESDIEFSGNDSND